MMSMFKTTRDEGEKGGDEPSVRRQGPPRPAMRLNLTRGADGRIRRADSTDIGDIWAEQQRIRLQQAIQEDRKKAEKRKEKTRRRQKLQGMLLRGKGTKRIKPHRLPSPPRSPETHKEVVVTLNLPKMRLPKLYAFKRLVRAITGRRKQLLLAGGIGGVCIAIVVVGFALYPDNRQGSEAKNDAKKPGPASLTSLGAPEYPTVLPGGKSIEELGGWARVSPLDKNAVYAYRDTVDKVPILVSQQPLPSSWKEDTAGAVEKLATQFSAKQKVSVDAVTAYIGTSEKGPQSVIFVKGETLILIKADAKVGDTAWAGYIASLR